MLCAFSAQQKAWIALQLFEDWFLNYFIPAIKEYYRKINTSLKILFVLRNTPGNSQHFGEIYPDNKVVFLPPNTSALIQPMDEGSIATFKAYYLWRTSAQAIEATEFDIMLREFGKVTLS